MRIHTPKIIKQNLLVCLLVGFFTHGALAQTQDNLLAEMPSGQYQLDLSHASVLWKVSHFGFSMYPGRFTDFSVDLKLDMVDFNKSSVTVEIKTDSIETAYPYPEKENFDQVLAKDWFNSEEFPSISFVSNSVSELSDNGFTINGDLTMLGVTKPVSLNATLNKATKKHPFVGKPVIGFSANAVVDRTEWGLTKFAPSIGKDVELEIEGEFSFGE